MKHRECHCKDCTSSEASANAVALAYQIWDELGLDPETGDRIGPANWAGLEALALQIAKLAREHQPRCKRPVIKGHLRLVVALAQKNSAGKKET